MKSWPRFIPLPSSLILCGATIIIGIIFFKQYSSTPENPTIKPLDTISEESGAVFDLDRIFSPLESYNVILERPLLSPEREPFFPVVIEQIETKPEVVTDIPKTGVTPEVENIEPEEIIKFTLHGTMQSNGKSFALIAMDFNEPDWQAEQSEIAGWTLHKVMVDVVELKKNTETIRIYLYENGQ